MSRIDRRTLIGSYVERAPLNPTVYDVFTGKANAELTKSDSGHTYATQNNTGAGGAPAIRNGLLTLRGAAPGSGTAATYAVIDLGSPVTHMGGVFQFGSSATTETGSAALICWSGPAGTIPNSTPCHLVVTPNYWELGVFVGAVFTSLSGQRYFASALPLGASLRVDAVIDQSLGVVHVLLPDGSSSSVWSPMIRSSVTGRYACWETYLNAPTDQISGFSEIWADAVRPVSARAPQASVMDVVASQGLARAGYGSSYVRPPSAKVGGQSYWDTTLGKQVVSTGSAWVDPAAANTPVGNLLTTFMATISLLAHSAVTSSVALAVSRAVVPAGRSKSLRITGNASGTGEFLTSPRTTGIVEGQTYSGYVRNFYTAGTARTFKTKIYWWTTADALVSTSISTGKTSTSAGWTTSDVITAVAPATAVKASFAVVIEGQAAAGEVFYATEFVFAPGTITDFIEV